MQRAAKWAILFVIGNPFVALSGHDIVTHMFFFNISMKVSGAPGRRAQRARSPQWRKRIGSASPLAAGGIAAALSNPSPAGTKNPAGFV